MPERLLVLFDGNAIIHRAYHAFLNTRPLTVSKTGEIVSAVYGFANILLKTVNDVKPTHWAIAFDRAAPTFRHEMYVEYKAHRPKTPDELVNQFARVKELVTAFNMPIFELDGFEADDVIGTLCHQATEQDIDTVIATGDGDAMQLVNPRVKVLYPKPGGSFGDTMLYDEKAVFDKYGVKPENIADYKSLVGDPSDNIPGVKGIGKVSAVKLIATFGTIEEIYTHLDQVTPPRVQELLRADEAAGRQSKILATIVTNAPVKLDLDACCNASFDRTRVTELFRELEFYSLLNRLPGAGEDVSVVEAAKTAAELPHTYRLITTPEDLDNLAGRLAGAKSFAIDVVTDEQAAMSAEIVGIAITPGEGEAYYVPIISQNSKVKSSRFLNVIRDDAAASQNLETTENDRSEGTGQALFEREKSEPLQPGFFGAGGQMGMSGMLPSTTIGTSQSPLELILGRLKPILEGTGDSQAGTPVPPAGSVPQVKLGHDTKFDITVLAEHGIFLKNVTFDTMVAAYLLSEKALSLKPLAFNRLEIEMTPVTDLTGQGSKQIPISQVSMEQVCQYACAEVDMTMRLASLFAPELNSQGLWSLFADVEMPLIPVLVHMERNGVLLDVELLKEMSENLKVKIQKLEVGIYEQVGHEFNISSPQQLSAVLFQDLKLTTGKKLKGGGYSTGAAILEELKGVHPVIDLVLDYRQLVKLKSTYVDALPLLVNKKTGRVHTSFNQTKTTTGRLSSTDPNLQNIPVRGELGRQIRHAFVVPHGTTLLAGDYSQIDLRALAHLSQDSSLLEAFNHDEDIHSATAAQIYGVPASQVTSDMRRLAKTVNFGVIYGMSSYGLEQATDLSREEAKKFIAAYFEKYAGVREYLEATKQAARDQGFVKTLLGRRRMIPEINSANRMVREGAERMAINMPVQGTSADIIKVAMINMYQAMNNQLPTDKSQVTDNKSQVASNKWGYEGPTDNSQVTSNKWGYEGPTNNSQVTSNKWGYEGRTNSSQVTSNKLEPTNSRPLKSKMLLQVHDELLFEVPDEELELMKQLVQEVMSKAVTLSVPLKVVIKAGRNWGELE